MFCLINLGRGVTKVGAFTDMPVLTPAHRFLMVLYFGVKKNEQKFLYYR